VKFSYKTKQKYGFRKSENRIFLSPENPASTTDWNQLPRQLAVWQLIRKAKCGFNEAKTNADQTFTVWPHLRIKP
jgi:hypothetical protein